MKDFKDRNYTGETIDGNKSFNNFYLNINMIIRFESFVKLFNVIKMMIFILENGIIVDLLQR